MSAEQPAVKPSSVHDKIAAFNHEKLADNEDDGLIHAAGTSRTSFNKKKRDSVRSGSMRVKELAAFHAEEQKKVERHEGLHKGTPPPTPLKSTPTTVTPPKQATTPAITPPAAVATSPSTPNLESTP